MSSGAETLPGARNWDLYRERMRQFYLVEDGKLVDLIKEMADIHGFSAKKWEYEAKFQEWGFRKNLKASEWAIIGRAISKRKSEGMESEVLLNGVLLPAKKVRKEILRNSRMTNQPESGEEDLPRGTILRTPPPDPAAGTVQTAGSVSPERNVVSTLLQPEIEFPNVHALISNREREGSLDIEAPPMMTSNTRESDLASDMSRSDSPSDLASDLSRSDSPSDLASDVSRSGSPSIIPGSPRSPLDEIENKIAEAISEGNVEELESHLDHGDNSTSLFSGQRGYEYIRAAIRKSNKPIKVVRFLVKNGADTEYKAKRALGEWSFLPNDDLPPLHLASKKNYPQIVRLLLGAPGASVDCEYDGRTPLELAVAFEAAQCARVLLHVGAAVDRVTSTGLTVLDEAYFKNIALYILLRGSSRKERLSYTISGVLFALSRGRLAEYLDDLDRLEDRARRQQILEAALCYSVNERGWSSAAYELLELFSVLPGTPTISFDENPSGIAVMPALLRTIMNNDVTGTDLLIGYGAERNIRHALAIAAGLNFRGESGGGLTILGHLLDQGADVATFGPDALRAAIESGHQDRFALLLAAGVEANSRVNGEYQLQVAAKKGDPKFMQLLLDAGAKINAWGSSDRGLTALHVAASSGDIESVQFLLDAGADVSLWGDDGAYGPTLLEASLNYWPISRERGQIFELLLNKGAVVNHGSTTRRCQEWNSALTILCSKSPWSLPSDGGDELLTRLITITLAAGANVNEMGRGEYASTPLQAASKAHMLSIVQMLIKAGANVNSPAGVLSGWTALQGAAQVGDPAVVQCLLKHGADVNAPAAIRGGMTTIQAASRSGNAAVVKILLEAGADPNADGSITNGKTALEWAAASGDSEAVGVLLQASATKGLPEALQMAEKEGHSLIAEYLRSHLNATMMA